MKVLLASSEVYPYSKTGGLADMVGAMASALAASGTDVTVVTPLYRGVAKHTGPLCPTGLKVEATCWGRPVRASVLAYRPGPRLTYWFIDQPAYFDRPALYQEHGHGYADNAERFVFFSRAVFQLARRIPAAFDIVHVHDWQTALVPMLINHERWRLGWKRAPRTCLTIHNLAYQGHFGRTEYELVGLPWDYFHPDAIEFYGGMNCLKAGIVFADMITTVSPSYAREILTPEFGCGLEGVLAKRSAQLQGVLNGVDYAEWNTEQNPWLNHRYDAGNLDGKSAEKADLQRQLGLPVVSDAPLFGNVSRLVDQKGSDLMLASLEEMLAAPMQFVLLGSGRPDWEDAFMDLAGRYPDQVAVRLGYDHGLAHRVEAASDFYLMPSRFEPCGLNQMYSLKYGSIPVVRATGGLDDTVIDATETVEAANGVKFGPPSAEALSRAIRKALVLYQHPEALSFYRQNGMTADFSWDRTVHEYDAIYRRMLNGH